MDWRILKFATLLQQAHEKRPYFAPNHGKYGLPHFPDFGQQKTPKALRLKGFIWWTIQDSNL